MGAMGTTVSGEKTDSVHASKLHADYKCTGSDMATRCRNRPEVAMHLMDAHANQAATATTVRAAILEAARPYPELRDLRVMVIHPTDDAGKRSGMVYAQLSRRWPREDKSMTMVEVGTHERLRISSEQATSIIATAWVYVPPIGCPICSAMPGWVCTTCRTAASGGQATYDHTKVRASFDGAPLESMTGKAFGEHLDKLGAHLAQATAIPASVLLGEPPKPDGYTFRVGCEGDARASTEDGWYEWYFGDPKTLPNTNARSWPPEHEAARQYAAHLLGQTAPPIRPETMGPDDPRRPASTERTPLPDGWTWDPGAACVADGPMVNGRRSYAGVESTSDEDDRGTVFTHDGKPCHPTILAALRTEAHRLGLPWVEPSEPHPERVSLPVGCPTPRVLVFANDRDIGGRVVGKLCRLGMEADLRPAPNAQRNVKYGPSTALLIAAMLQCIQDEIGIPAESFERWDEHFAKGCADVFVNLP
jgi:hypothetical protein